MLTDQNKAGQNKVDQSTAELSVGTASPSLDELETKLQSLATQVETLSLKPSLAWRRTQLITLIRRAQQTPNRRLRQRLIERITTTVSSLNHPSCFDLPGHKRRPTQRPLQALLQTLESTALVETTASTGYTLESVLSDMEQRMVQEANAHTTATADDDSPNGEQSNTESDGDAAITQGEADAATQGLLGRRTKGLPQLKSLRRIQQHDQFLQTQLLLRQAILNAPDAPGPLNPQALSLRALKAMNGISPAYFARYIGYIDTLFSLAKVDEAMQRDAEKPKS